MFSLFTDKFSLFTDKLAMIWTPLSLVLLVAVITGSVLLIFGYTKPNIGYQIRNHRDRDYTFFIRNLDSVHYMQPMHVVISGRGLKYVEIQAGPWSDHRPVKIGETDGRVRVRVIFDEVPEEAAFAIRARCVGDVPHIEIAEDSPLQPRSFRQPIGFTFLTKFLHYGLRYMTGMIGFLMIFGGGLYIRQVIYDIDWTEASDKVIALIAAIVSGLCYALVVPLGGKRTIVGYVTSVETDQYWGERGRNSGNITRLEKE